VQDAQVRTIPTEIPERLSDEGRETLFQVGIRLAGGMSMNEVARDLAVKRTELERRLQALREEMLAGGPSAG
jgi:hypothetical protein